MEVCLEVWISVQPQEDKNQGTSGEILWMPLQWICSPHGSRKVDAVHTLSTPTNVIELLEFLSMVTSLSPFIPGLSNLTASLCELLKKDAEFNWDAPYQAAFQCVKDSVVSNTTLW